VISPAEAKAPPISELKINVFENCNPSEKLIPNRPLGRLIGPSAAESTAIRKRILF
jgi:hypothetical protein